MSYRQTVEEETRRGRADSRERERHDIACNVLLQLIRHAGNMEHDNQQALAHLAYKMADTMLVEREHYKRQDAIDREERMRAERERDPHGET